MADLKPIPFGSTPIAPIPFGSKPIAPVPAAPAEPNILQKLGSTVSETAGNVVNRVKAGAQALDDSASGKIEAPEAGLRIFGQVVGVGNDLVGGAVKAGLQTVNAATGGLAAKAAQGTLGAIAQTPLGAMGVQAIKGGLDKWQEFSDKYPRAAADLQAIPEAASMLANFVGGGVAVKGVKEAAPLLKTAATTAIDTAKTGTTALAERSTAKALDRTVEAVNPELKGTAKVQGYKDVVKGTREVTPGGVLKQQALGASAREADVGKRLFQEGIRLENKPVKDLVTLRGALKDTEAKLEDVLAGDPSLVFNADKPTLMANINRIATKMPEEFKAIKDNGAVFNSVLNFGKRIIAKTPDDVRGLRNARSAFDAQAKIEFPSAFKEGSIDTKTPAGRAIKAVRDAINDHLYETAPEGSEIKRLIGVESDIFRATDAIAPRAAATHGTSKAEQLFEAATNHPLITAGLTYEAAKHTLVPQLPGI